MSYSGGLRNCGISGTCKFIELAKVILNTLHCQHAIAGRVEEARVLLITRQPLLKELPRSRFLG